MTAPAGKILLVDDDEALRMAVAQGLALRGFDVAAFDNAPAALKAVSRDFDGAVVSDVRMPGMDGLALFERIRAIDADIPVLLITGHGDVAMAVAALQDGVYDFVSKPFPMERLTAALSRALEKRSLVLDNRRLEAVAQAAGGSLLLGDTPVMQRLRSTIAQLAEAEVDVLIQGETGVGKGLVAQALHRGGARRNRPMVTVNCAAVPEAVFETELFGAAAAGGVRSSTGRIERADRGVLFLDEIEGLSPAMQAKLLRLVEEREIWPVGAAEPRHLDLRIVAASKIDLAEAVRSGAFRADLYYRLNVVTLIVPPLRERREDVPSLFGHFLAEAAARLRRPTPRLTAAVRDHLLGHDWPGNVRELAHYAERVVLGLPSAATAEDAAQGVVEGLAERTSRYEAMVIRETLAACGGDARTAMALLGTPRKTFYDKLRRHGIEIDRYRSAKA